MRMLDLFCGEGLASWGYWRSARFSEIVGVDIENMSNRYAFDFVQTDALSLDYDFLMSFDFIHASPPCQAYSKATRDKSRHMRMILNVHLMLTAAGVPYVIENVEGSSRELRPNLVLDGKSLGLQIQRRRYFHVSGLASTERLINMRHVDTIKLHGGDFVPREQMIQAMGLDKMISGHRLNLITRDGIAQGIPPAFTKYIAERLFTEKLMIS